MSKKYFNIFNVNNKPTTVSAATTSIPTTCVTDDTVSFNFGAPIVSTVKCIDSLSNNKNCDLGTLLTGPTQPVLAVGTRKII